MSQYLQRGQAKEKKKRVFVMNILPSDVLRQKVILDLEIKQKNISFHSVSVTAENLQSCFSCFDIISYYYNYNIILYLLSLFALLLFRSSCFCLCIYVSLVLDSGFGREAASWYSDWGLNITFSRDAKLFHSGPTRCSTSARSLARSHAHAHGSLLPPCFSSLSPPPPSSFFSPLNAPQLVRLSPDHMTTLYGFKLQENDNNYVHLFLLNSQPRPGDI